MKLTSSDSLFLCLLLLVLGGTRAYALSTTAISDEIEANMDSIEIPPVERLVDSVRWMRKGEPTRLFKQESNKSDNFFLRFNEVDTSYTEPQKYDSALILWNTNAYEVYRLNSSSEQSITFIPEATVCIGPYFSWRWIFLGYTLDIKYLDFWNKNSNPRQEYDLNLYSSMLGSNIHYRKIGSDYRIRQLYLGKNTNTDAIHGIDFGGLTSTIRGFNLYYIFSHRRFPHLAAFSQSTTQHHSVGSPLLGIGYTQHNFDTGWEGLNRIISDRLGSQVPTNPTDNTLMFSKIKYTDIPTGGGYTYNWVFARNWVLAGSFSLVLTHESSRGDVTQRTFFINDFKFSSINVDGTGRFGMAWNNSKRYVGMSTILHVYNHRCNNFSINNFFGSINLYTGFNFGRRKEG